jgi:hypothetical protein
MLHIRCGTDIVADLRTGGVPGEILVWQDPLCEGPTPALPPAAWYDRRADFIGRTWGLDPAAVRSGLEAADRALARSLDEDEVVLWFEHDMFDQAILARLLAWYAEAPSLPRRLSIVTANAHPAIPRFIGLGNLDAAQLMELFGRRAPIGPEALALGREIWAAWTSADPRALAALGRRGMPELPFLPAAIRRHLEELPWTTDGLGLTERLILRAIADGATGREVFARVMDAEPAPWMGDSMCYDAIRQLARDPALVSIEGAWSGELEELAVRGIRRTAAGDAVLGGHDRLALGPIDRWVGGVHLSASAARWRWDPEQAKPVAA